MDNRPVTPLPNPGLRPRRSVTLARASLSVTAAGTALVTGPPSSPASIKDSVLTSALLTQQYPTGQGNETEFLIDPAKFVDAFASDVPEKEAAVMAATQRPVSLLGFSEPTGSPAWKNFPSWAVVATGDKAAGSDVVRSMAERAGATSTEVEGSHVIMVSQPQAVTEVIMQAVNAVAR